MPIYIILLSVLCSASAQVFLKIGMRNFDGSFALTPDNIIPLSLKLATNLWLVGGVFFYIFSLLTWLYVLKQVEVSTAYPFISLGFVFVAGIGFFFLNETISPLKLIGMLFIITGIVFLSKSLS